jgi:hypothetical protein
VHLFHVAELHKDGSSTNHAVRCKGCNSYGPRTDKGKEEAIRLWNCRAY